VRVPSKLKLATGQVNSLRLFLEMTSDKREFVEQWLYFRKQKTYDYIAREQSPHKNG
jgi:hypothetical protein